MQDNTPAPLLEQQYRIPFALFQKAFIAFQKKYVYPKSYLLMAVFLLIAGVYGYFLVGAAESQRPMYCMVMLLCLVLCALQWFNPRKIRRNLLEAVREIEDDQYFLRVFQDYLEIGTILPEEAVSGETQQDDALFEDAPQENFTGQRIHYNSEMKLTEYREFFMLYQTKSMFYVIPKDAFSEEETEILRVHFSQKLPKQFQRLEH